MIKNTTKPDKLNTLLIQDVHLELSCFSRQVKVYPCSFFYFNR